MTTAILAAIAAAGVVVYVNQATVAELSGLPGVGVKTAQSIIDEREENGPFRSPRDLGRVRGLRPALRAQIAALVSFDGELPVATIEAVTPERSPRAALDVFAHEPTFEEVRRRALGVAGIRPARVEDWRQRVRASAWAPSITASMQGEVDASGKDVIDQDASEAPVRTDEDARGARLTLSASWQLERLVFHPDELDIAREAVRQENLRSSVVAEIVEAYFERRRAQVILAFSPASEPEEAVRDDLEVQEGTAKLDAWTDGWFSAEVRRRQQGESEP